MPLLRSRIRLLLFRGTHFVKLLLAAFALVALPVMAAEPTLYGRYEYIQLPEIGETFKAKMDTGPLRHPRYPAYAALLRHPVRLFPHPHHVRVRRH